MMCGHEVRRGGEKIRFLYRISHYKSLTMERIPSSLSFSSLLFVLLIRGVYGILKIRLISWLRNARAMIGCKRVYIC